MKTVELGLTPLDVLIIERCLSLAPDTQASTVQVEGASTGITRHKHVPHKHKKDLESKVRLASTERLWRSLQSGCAAWGWITMGRRRKRGGQQPSQVALTKHQLMILKDTCKRVHDYSHARSLSLSYDVEDGFNPYSKAEVKELGDIVGGLIERHANNKRNTDTSL
jgi:hypothetical protein